MQLHLRYGPANLWNLRHVPLSPPGEDGAGLDKKNARRVTTRVIEGAPNLNVQFWTFPNFEDRLIPNFESIKMFDPKKMCQRYVFRLATSQKVVTLAY